MIVGWRAWRVALVAGEPRLVSLVRERVWDPGAPVAGAFAAADRVRALRCLAGRDDDWVVHRVVGIAALADGVEVPGGWRGAAVPFRLWVPERRAGGRPVAAAELAAGLAAYGVPVEVGRPDPPLPLRSLPACLHD